jgi:hypothetical protein
MQSSQVHVYEQCQHRTKSSHSSNGLSKINDGKTRDFNDSD